MLAFHFKAIELHFYCKQHNMEFYWNVYFQESVKSSYFPLFFLSGGHFEVCKLLIDAKAQVNSYDNMLITPLHHAARGILVS